MPDRLKKVISELPLPTDFEWSQDLSNSDYRAALQKIDEKIMEDPSNLPARLWWIQCQSELGEIPASALNTPLEDVVPKLIESKSHYEDGISTCLKVALRLLERKQTKLASVLLERANDFSNLSTVIRDETKTQIRDSLVDVLKLEKERAELKREQKSYLEALDRKIDELKSAKVAPQPPPKAEPRKRKPTMNISAASLLQEAIEQAEASTPVLEPEIVSEVPHIEPGLSLGVTNHTRAAILITICGSLMIILGLYSSSSSYEPTSEEHYSEVLAVSLLPSDFPALKIPTLQLAERQSESSLELMTKRLERLKDTTKDESKPSGLAWNESGPKVVTEKVVMVPPPQATPHLSQQDRAKLPEMNPDRLAGAVLESLGSSPGQAQVVGVTRGPDGRIYGPPPSGDPSAKSLDGSQLRGVEVEQMKTPQIYKIIAPTAVFSAPSVIAQSVARLEPKAKIQVVAKVGKWLELRSSGGRKGYIYAQDAEMEK